MLTKPGQRAALLDVMVIKQKKPSRNGVTACCDNWIAAAYKKK